MSDTLKLNKTDEEIRAFLKEIVGGSGIARAKITFVGKRSREGNASTRQSRIFSIKSEQQNP